MRRRKNMKLKKKILAMFIVFAILVMATLPVSAETVLDSTAKLNVLSNLTIINDNPLTYI
jgi:hypothetical protein